MRPEEERSRPAAETLSALAPFVPFHIGRTERADASYGYRSTTVSGIVVTFSTCLSSSSPEDIPPWVI
jgi:hypothetical protein